MMPQASDADFLARFSTFASGLKATFQSHITGDPEDQLKPPVAQLLRDFGALMNMKIETKTESTIAGVGRPDIAVGVSGLLAGYVELKAPGFGADTTRFKGHNKSQWEKFKALPNLLYTDGNEWILYRTGERKQAIKLTGDITVEGAKCVKQSDAAALSNLLRDFFSWQPIMPKTPKGLAEILAPLCHLLRDDVMKALENPASNLSTLAQEWRSYLFPDAKDAQFADAYAQTLTYALLLARLSGATNLSTYAAADVLQHDHSLLAQTLRILGQPQAKTEIALGVDLLERSIAAVNADEFAKQDGDPWLYFYEDFLAAYDPKLRRNRGVYYTPVQTVRAQVRLISHLLTTKMGKTLSYASDDVVVLDPAAGTGTYPLAVLQHGLDTMPAKFGLGSRGDIASAMAKNIHAFELLVGPYAVAHLRLSERVLDAGGSLPSDGVHVYLADTLESPHASPPGQFPLAAKELAEEHQRALRVKNDTRVLVCLGNPPYNRQEADGTEGEEDEQKGGWIRLGDPGDKQNQPLLEDFLMPARDAGNGVHLHNLYNDYVYFWRWALWKVFEKTQGPGIISFITASSYLRGPGFVGMREMMRRTFDELWIIDLEGDQLGARKTESIFAIRTPVAIAVGVRYGDPKPSVPAHVHYAKIEGSRDDKLAKLDSITQFTGLTWEDCFTDWQKPFLPVGKGDYFSWPLITDLFPWQQSGVKVGRKWPIAPDKDALSARWSALVSSLPANRKVLFKDSPTGKKQTSAVTKTALPKPASTERISELPKDAPVPAIVRYGHRSYDRQWLLADNRLLDRASPLWYVHSDKQVYMTSLLTGVLGLGPAATVTGEVPDLHFYCSRGGKDVIPLWRNVSTTEANVSIGLLDYLASRYGVSVSPEDLFAYAYGVLSSLAYVEIFSEELTLPGPRVPITSNLRLFQEGAELGRKLVQMHTYGTRFNDAVEKAYVLEGRARITKGILGTTAEYPATYGYNAMTQTLSIGNGEVSPVDSRVWSFGISGLNPVRSWLDYRMKEASGRSSSPLDDVGEKRWTLQMTEELLTLLWTLEATIDQQPLLSDFLNRVVASETIPADALPYPSAEERKAPKSEVESEIEQGAFPL